MPLTRYNKRSGKLVAELSADFQPRYEPNFAWGNTVSAIMALPGLRGFWPCSSVYHTAADRLLDVSGNGNHLTATAKAGDIRFGFFDYSLVSWAWLAAANNQAFQRADGGAANWADITGTEAYITAARGITIGGWFRLSTIGSAQVLMSKWGVTAPLADQRSYELSVTAGNNVQFSISSAGTAATVNTATSTTEISANTWFFAVGSHFAGVRTYITLNDETVEDAYAANIFDSAAPFEVGIWDNRDVGGSGAWLNGRCSMMFLCAESIDTSKLQTLFDATRAMYGIRL